MKSIWFYCGVPVHNVSYTAGHACGKISAHSTQNYDDTTSHIFATVVTNALKSINQSIVDLMTKNQKNHEILKHSKVRLQFTNILVKEPQQQPWRRNSGRKTVQRRYRGKKRDLTWRHTRPRCPQWRSFPTWTRPRHLWAGRRKSRRQTSPNAKKHTLIFMKHHSLHCCQRKLSTVTWMWTEYLQLSQYIKAPFQHSHWHRLPDEYRRQMPEKHKNFVRRNQSGWLWFSQVVLPPGSAWLTFNFVVNYET